MTFSECQKWEPHRPTILFFVTYGLVCFCCGILPASTENLRNLPDISRQYRQPSRTIRYGTSGSIQRIATRSLTIDKSNGNATIQNFRAVKLQLFSFINLYKKKRSHRKRLRRVQKDYVKIMDKTITIVSSHSGFVRIRILYVADGIVAGKSLRIVNKEGKRAPITFRLSEWRSGKYFLELSQRLSTNTKRYVVGDDQHGGLRVCRSSSAIECRRANGGRTVATPMFKLLQARRADGRSFSYQWVIAFLFGDTEKYVTIVDTTGEATLVGTVGEATRFMFVLNNPTE